MTLQAQRNAYHAQREGTMREKKVNNWLLHAKMILIIVLMFLYIVIIFVFATRFIIASVTMILQVDRENRKPPVKNGVLDVRTQNIRCCLKNSYK